MKTKLMIGGVEVENPVFFAPLAGVSVAAVRRLFRRLGAALTHTEMVSSAGLLYAGPKTWQMTECTDEERPLVLQLFTGDADSLCRSAERCLQSRSYAAFGVNMACPMPKVHKKGAGSRLLQNPDVAFAMVRELKKFGLPVWPKIRKIVPDGREYRLDTLQFAEGLLEAGADNVTIHGRTPQQRYEGKADKSEVVRAARRFEGKITASGDVYAAADVAFYLDNGCAAVLCARGAIADPFMVVHSLRVLGYNNRILHGDPSLQERAEILTGLADDLYRLHGGRAALVLLRRFLSGFFRGQAGTAEFKRTLASAKDWDSAYRILRDWRSYFERGFM